MFVGAYWSQRAESVTDAAARIAAFLKLIGQQADLFSTWYSKSRSRAASLREPLALDAALIERKLRVNHRDIDRQPVPELGFAFSAWNGKNASVSVSIGVCRPHVGNSVILSITTGSELSMEACRALLGAMVSEFDPDYAVVTSLEIMARFGAKKPWDVGWLTYERETGIRELALG